MARTDRALLQASGGAVRIGAGLALLYGADATAYPAGVFLFGTVLVCAGVLVLAVSPKRFAGWIDRWLGGSMVARLRVGGLLAVLAGALLCASVAV